MKNLRVLTFLLIIFISCESRNQLRKDNNVPYKVAENYFIKNSAKEVYNPKIISQQDFDKIFGMATGMGENGKPTTIDFSKEYVIAVIKPETNKTIELTPVSVQKNEQGKVIFTYKTKTGAVQSYTTKPVLIIIVDKTYDGDVQLKEIN